MFDGSKEQFFDSGSLKIFQKLTFIFLINIVFEKAKNCHTSKFILVRKK
jgi:hypothetical protein